MEETSDKTASTLVAAGKPIVSIANPEACLVRIYPTGPGMGTRYTLGAKPMVLGRDGTCDIHVDDKSVSRRHARIQPGVDGYSALDLQSTNGTFVNDRPGSQTKLNDGDYLRIGNWIFRFLAGGNIETEYHEEIYRLTIIDALTGIHNKRFLLEFLDRELARSARYSRPLTLVLFDIDWFKSINDQLGHLGGDSTLRELVIRVKGAIRKEELFARYGGEEFALVLPETNLEGGKDVAERIRNLVGNHPFLYEGCPYTITISLGVFAIRGQEALSPIDLIREADQNLFAAKNAGRNRVVASGPLQESASGFSAP
ncbi:MAG TPA: GGDEF domain-containing protein [Gemmataceae bacterium]|jgi:diguanylate cyclase (GGDEF)-like protein|nr:GGDEF domain-containing protein [Gemmataceae bacterium]